MFIGYPHGQKGWRVYDIESGDIFVSRDVTFDEATFPFASSLGHDEVDRSQPSPCHMGEDDSMGLWGSKPRDLDQQAALQDRSLLPPCPVSAGPNESACLRVPDPAPLEPAYISQPAATPQGRLASPGPSGPLPSTEISPYLLGSSEPSTLPVDRAGDSGHPMISGPLDRGSNPQAPNTGREKRITRPPSHLADYLCYTTRPMDPSSTAHPPKKVSSGKSYPIANYVTCKRFSENHKSYMAAITKIIEPRYFHEAVKDPKWREAMSKEIEALELNNTWTLAELPVNKRPINCKWVYKVKYNSDGSVERYKARLVIRGDQQIEGFDYGETFAPVAKMTSVRCFIAVAATKGWDLHQMDVHNAFLHGDLDEEVYMTLPPGYRASYHNQVCRLRKSLHGLKQAPRQWFAKLSSKLMDYGFIRSYADYSLFTYHKEGKYMALLVYVDDIILMGNDANTCREFKEYLNHCFHIKDLGSLKYFLGLEVARNSRGIFLTQRKYALELVEECGLLGSKPTDFPIETNHKLALSDGAFLQDPMQYRRLVGKLIYLTITRPELCYAVHTLAQFMQAPREAHMEAARRVLKYLKGCPGRGLFLQRDCDMRLYAFGDSDWGACPLT